MFKYSMDGVTVETVLDLRRAKKNGKYPVKIRIGYNRRFTYYSTGKDLAPEEWQRLPTTKQRGQVSTREDIQASFSLVREAVRDLLSYGAFTFQLLNSRLKGAGMTTINDLIKLRIEDLRQQERIASMKRYISTLTALENYAGNKIYIADITPEWLAGFQNKRLAEGKAQNTIAIALNALKTILNEALSNGLIKPADFPFGRNKFIVREGEGRKLALTAEQVAILAQYEGSPALCKHRDIWLFMFMCNGISIADLARLKYSNISDGEICFIRQKTRNSVSKRKYIRVPITKPMQDIIDKWGNAYHPDAYIFPILSGTETATQAFYKVGHYMRNMNHHTNILGEILGLGPITTYTARHSFATALKRSGVNVAYISESLGHTNIKITETYLAAFEKEERNKNAQIITSILQHIP